ncbi:MFS transporter [Paracoccus indicus]|uniref:MFS transporter n=1 Tax=Paracoccus indicus TaxID=2079229 RepID=UPI000D3D7471|nr:MFS transporter [Paracoccus indicus]
MRLSFRAAVSLLFFVNGMTIGSWAPKLPTLMARLQISESVAGLIVLCLGAGSMCIMPVFGAMVARRGSARAVGMAAWLSAPLLLVISVAPGIWTVAAAVFLFGGFLGGMDVAMNANAVAVERVRSRAIMSSCHGFWSMGAFVGAAGGGMAIQHFGELAHGAIVLAIFALVLVIALPALVQDAPADDAPRAPLRLPRSPLPYLLGVMALTAMIPEGAILDWAAVHLRQDMGSSLAVAGWGFAGCAATMAVMRFLGDGIRQRLGAVTTMRLSAVIAMAGLALAGLAGSAGVAIAGFALAGIGIANMVPIAFSAAGNMPGLAAGMGLSVVTMMGYSGILLAPGLIGWLAERIGLGPIYVGLALLLIVPLALSRLARSADFDAG